MNWRDWREGWLKVAGLWQRRRRERELAEELAFHLAMKERKYRESQGLAAQQAAERAKRDFGGFEKWKEVCRDVTRWRVMDEFGRDLILAVRMLRKSAVFTVVALVTLTLAIGANTAIFSLMNTVMLKALPVPNAARLVMLREQHQPDMYGFSYPVFKETAKRTSSMMQVFAFTGRTLQMPGEEGVEEVAGELVSGQYFAALGVRPQMGRWIVPGDDRPGAPAGAVAVASNRFWRNHMNGDPSVVGRRLRLSQVVFTVIGVMPERFRGMDNDSYPDVFIPFEVEPAVDAPFDRIAAGYQHIWFQMGARLKDGVSFEGANAFLRTSSHEFYEVAAPNQSIKFNGHKPHELGLIAESGMAGYSGLRLRFRKPLTVLMALVLMVLLIACLNLATLLTARASSRGLEITTRFALGASRGRLLRQLLTESLLIAVSGAALGLALSPVLARFLATMMAPQHDPQEIPLNVAPDLTVFLFTAAVAVVATVLSGVLPALRSTSGELQSGIREGSHTLRSAERRRLWPRVLLSSEVALALVLVTGASLLGYSLLRLHRIPPGFEPRGLVYLQPDMNKQARQGSALINAYHEIVNEIRSLPDVTAVGLLTNVPLTMKEDAGNVNVPGGVAHEVWDNIVGPDYFRTMRTPLLQGREFRWTDTGEKGKKVILNESAARLLFPKGDALGRYLNAGGKTLSEVIGVAADAKYTRMRDTAPPTMYSPAMQDVSDGESFVILVRTSGKPAPLIAAAGKIVRRVVPDIPAPAAFSMEETIAESLTTERIMATLALFFGGLALLMTGIGLYGTLAYATERRTGEIGIRLALGARPGNIISMVCGENGVIALLGCAVGIAGSVAASKTIASYLYGVSARDPMVFGVAAVLLLCVATAASLVPAVKAARIDPITAIRYE